MLEQMYQEIILDHYRNPQGKHLLDEKDVEVHHINPTCGDEITLQARVNDTVHFGYESQGCSISQASASILFQELDGVDIDAGMAAVDEFLTLMQSGTQTYTPDEDVLGDAVVFAGVAKYPARVKCALLPWMAWKDAVAQAVDQKGTP